MAETRSVEGRARNQRIADRLREAAGLLAAQGANPFRVRAYREAAHTLETLERDIGDILEEQGVEGLERLPRIGRSIAGAIVEMLRTGRWAQLERLRGAVDPVGLFTSLPGVGPALAKRIYDTLGIDTLEELELAAYDGRLQQVRGIGPKRAAMLRAVVGEMLARTRRGRRRAPQDEPDVATLLDVDQEYRGKAEAGKLPTIAPRRFNPQGEAWLPILHTQRGPWHFTALYSNTALAHELGTVRDWVVIYFQRDNEREEGQRTVVTETRGPLVGKRVVRGRERECRAFYGL